MSKKPERLSLEEAYQDFEQLLAQIDAEIEAHLYGQPENKKRAVLLHLRARLEDQLRARFMGDDYYRSYLHTKKERVIEKLDQHRGGLSDEGIYYDDESILNHRPGSEVEYVIATQADTGEPIAVKLLKRYSTIPIQETFRQEQGVLRKLLTLYHQNYPPNLIKLYAYSRGISVTELIPGAKNLQEIIDLETLRSPEDLATVMNYMRAAVAGLNALYDAGFQYHGDIKTSNCIIDKDDNLVLCDFSLVDCMQGQRLKPHSYTHGTPRYMSAERCICFYDADGQQAKIDKRVDVFALGVMFHEMITCGKDPFDRDLMEDRMQREPRAWFAAAFADFILKNNLVFLDPEGTQYSPSTLKKLAEKHAHRPLSYHGCTMIRDKTILKRLDQVIHKALEPDPKNRYSSPQKFLDAIEAVLQYRHLLNKNYE